MQVMCINQAGWEMGKTWLFGLIKKKVDVKGPEYGDRVTVVSEYWDEGILYYNLLEWPPNDANDGWQSDCFIPISDLDETTMERNYKTKTV